MGGGKNLFKEIFHKNAEKCGFLKPGNLILPPDFLPDRLEQCPKFTVCIYTEPIFVLTKMIWGSLFGGGGP